MQIITYYGDQDETESKQIALNKMRNLAMLPSLADDLDELDSVFGSDPWTYGVEPNRTTFGALIRYIVEQGLMASEVAVDGLFVPVV